MDDTEWAANGFFSPSKARLAQAQARDWSFVDAWLRKKYVAARVPAFERNEDTLQALLTIITLSEAADERRLVVDRVEKLAMHHYARRYQQRKAVDTVYEEICARLEEGADDSIDRLARLSLLLTTPIKASGGSAAADGLIASAITLQMQAFESQQAEQAAMSQYETLTCEHLRLTNLLAALKDGSFDPPSNSLDETAQWAKGVKHLRAKLNEYDERLSAARPTQQSLLEMLEVNRRSKNENADREAQLQELDSDIEALKVYSRENADEQISRLKEQLHRLQGKRDGLSHNHSR